MPKVTRSVEEVDAVRDQILGLRLQDSREKRI